MDKRALESLTQAFERGGQMRLKIQGLLAMVAVVLASTAGSFALDANRGTSASRLVEYGDDISLYTFFVPLEEDGTVPPAYKDRFRDLEKDLEYRVHRGAMPPIISGPLTTYPSEYQCREALWDAQRYREVDFREALEEYAEHAEFRILGRVIDRQLGLRPSPFWVERSFAVLVLEVLDGNVLVGQEIQLIAKGGVVETPGGFLCTPYSEFHPELEPGDLVNLAGYLLPKSDHLCASEEWRATRRGAQ